MSQSAAAEFVSHQQVLLLQSNKKRSMHAIPLPITIQYLREIPSLNLITPGRF